MGDQQNENRNSCENPSATHPVCSLEKPTKKVIYNRSRIVHMDEMIRAILPKLDTDERESVNQCYQAWKMKQVKTHTLLHQLRSIVSSDVLQNEVERIRQDKWKRNKQSNTTRCSSQSRRLFPTTDCQHLAQDNSCDSTTENTSVATSREDETYHNTEESLDKQRVKRSWTKEEHFLFLQGLQEYGKGQWQCIANKIGTKTASQVRSHCKKYLMRQQKDQQSKKMKTIHDMTMESPEMQQLAMKQQNEMTQDDANVLYREKSFVPLHTKFGKDNATSDRSLGNQLGSETDGNSEWYNDEPQDNQYASITKIPYFIRERRIRRLEYCLQQMKQSMNWMWSNITKWDSFDRSN